MDDTKLGFWIEVAITESSILTGPPSSATGARGEGLLLGGRGDLAGGYMVC